MGQKGLILAFFGQSSRFLADFFFNEIGGYTPPLRDDHCAQKNLAERGGTPPPKRKKSAK